MLKIGDFSKLAHITVKTLRHYADMGLLKPVWIDRYTGYRYYSLEQLPKLNRILALKDLGFSLQQIKQMVDENLSLEELRGMVRMKKAELEDRMLEEQLRLKRIESRIRQIEHEDLLAHYEVVIKNITPQFIAVLHELVPVAEQILEFQFGLQKRFCALLEAQKVVLEGYWLVTRFERDEYSEKNIHLEVGKIIPEGVQVRSQGGLIIKKAPSNSLIASVMHSGRLSDISFAYQAFYSWLSTSGYRISGPACELMLSVPISDVEVSNWLIELQVPLEPEMFRLGTKRYLITQMEEIMEPKIIEKPAFWVAGTLYRGRNENQEIAVMWSEAFLPRMKELNRVNNWVTYGVCSVPAGLPDGVFEYVAGCEVADPDDLPDGMVAVQVPAQKYAVFKHRGLLETLQDTYHYIWHIWLPKSGYEKVDGPDLEVYDEKFMGFSEDSILNLYIPIK